MANIPLTGAQSLGVRAGHMAYSLNLENTDRGVTQPARAQVTFADFTTLQTTVVNNLWATIGNGPNPVSGSPSSQYTAGAGLVQAWQSLVQNTLIAMADTSSPLTQQTVQAAATLLNSQMVSAGTTFQKPTVTQTIASGANVGNAVLVSSVTNRYGIQSDYVYAETQTFTCTADGWGGGGGNTNLAFVEPYAFAGPPATGLLDSDWPQGSGGAGTINAADGDNQTLIQNGGFETWASALALPSNWSLVLGTVGTTIVRSTNVYVGNYALSFVGNGAELTGVKQQVALAPVSVYMLNAFVAVSAVPAAGVLAIRLVDGNNAVVNDQAGTPNTLSVNLATGGSTSYLPLNGTFRTPQTLPLTGLFLEISLTTALSNTKVVYVDLVAFVAPQQLYACGGYVSIFSGSVQATVGDSFTVTYTNSGNSQSFQKGVWQRICGLDRLSPPIQLPSAVSPTVADALIV